MQALPAIHRLNSKNWKQFRTIRLQALEDSPDAFGSTLEKERQYSDDIWINRLSRTDVATFVATAEEGSDVGLVTAAPYDQFLGLYSMWVSPQARKSGVGGALVDELIQWATQQNHTRILLDVADQNTAAIAFYDSRGFKPTGVVGTLPSPREHITEHQRELLL